MGFSEAETLRALRMVPFFFLISEAETLLALRMVLFGCFFLMFCF
jgi:hypothetical protein